MRDTETMNELMASYERKKCVWVKRHNTDRGFERWFIERVCGRKRLSKKVVSLLELAAQYLEHPDVTAMNFALNSAVVAKRIRRVTERQRLDRSKGR
jgi:hypothetical protein